MPHHHLDATGSVEETELADGVHIVSLHGYADAHDVHAVLQPLATADGTAIVVDLEDAVGLDETLLAVIATSAHSAFRHGGQLGIITRSNHVSDLVRECGLSDIVSLHTSLREAVPRA